MRLPLPLPLPHLAVLIAALGAGLPARADTMQSFGHYVVHYGAVNTMRLLPQVAAGYGIERSNRQGLINLTVRQGDENGEPVSAVLNGTATDLSGHAVAIGFREIRVDGSVAYVGLFPLSGSDTFRFAISVRPDGVNVPYALKFSQDITVD